jgi:hypothetical protein
VIVAAFEAEGLAAGGVAWLESYYIFQYNSFGLLKCHLAHSVRPDGRSKSPNGPEKCQMAFLRESASNFFPARSLSHTTPCFEHHHHVGAAPEPSWRLLPHERLQWRQYSQVNDPHAATDGSSAEAAATAL